jgi:beta-lactam-binding protein with PASTA domain
MRSPRRPNSPFTRPDSPRNAGAALLRRLVGRSAVLADVCLIFPAIVGAAGSTAQASVGMVNPPLVRDVFAHPSITDTPAEQAVRRLVMDELARLSGQAEPYVGTTVTTSSGEVGTTALVEAEKTAPAAVQRAAWAARLRAAATSLPRVTGTVGLVVGAGALGYTIGTGLNKMFFHINQPVGLSSTNVGNPDRLDYRLGATTTDSCALNGNAWMPGPTPLIATAATVTTPELGVSTGGCSPGRTVALGNGVWAIHYTAGRNGGYFFYDGVNPSHSGFSCPNDQGMVGAVVLGSDGGVCEYGFSMWTLADADPSTPHAYDSAADGTVDPTRQLGALPAPTETTVTDAVNDPASTPWVDKIDDELHPDGFPVTVPAPVADEIYPDYLDRLQALGLDGQITQATGSDIDTSKAAKAVLSVDPTAGTSVSPGTTVDVVANPDVLPEPPPATATIPSCDRKTYEECSAALEANGFKTHHKVTLDFDTADLDAPADHVVSLVPATGGQEAVTTDIAVKTNPGADQMPVVVPNFDAGPGEDFASYAQKLQTLGLVGDETFVPAPADGDVVNADAHPGTRVHQGDHIQVSVNTQPNPLDDPNGPSTDTGDNRCDLGNQGNDEDPNPAAGQPGPPLNQALYEPVAHFSRATGAVNPDGSPEMVPVDLLMGYTKDVRPNPRRWTGWGYRKIYAKHGWTADDVAATEDALTHFPVPDPASPENLTYIGAEYDAPATPGMKCVRVVGVLTAKTAFETVPRQILTSYGQPVKLPTP